MISHTFSIDELILGGSLESLLYAYKTETPIIIDKSRRPFELDMAPSELDWSFLGYKPETDVGSLRLWERLSFLLSLSGLLLFPNSIENITEHHNRLVIVTHNMRKLEVTFNKLRKFDTNFTNYAWVYDWFAVRSGGKHDIDFLEDEEYLAHKLIFHPSQRIGVFEPIRIEHMHRERKEQIIPHMTLGQIMGMPTITEGKLWNMTTSLFKRKLLFT